MILTNNYKFISKHLNKRFQKCVYDQVFIFREAQNC